MSETKSYICDSLVNHDGKLHAIGEIIELTDDAAEPLLALGRISVPASDPVPSNVVSLGDAKKKPSDSEQEPSDPDERQAAILAAIDGLDKDDGNLWLKSGAPDTRALSEALGWKVTAAERDEALR